MVVSAMPTREELRKWKEEHIPEYMNKLREAYNEVYNDVYRESQHGYFKRYLKKFQNMLNAMGTAVSYVHMLRDYEHDNDPDIQPLLFFHEAHHFIENCKGHKTLAEDSGAMVILERYLIQVHRFLDTKEFDRFSVYSGDCWGGHQWFDFTYSEEDKAYVVADEYVEDYAKAYNLVEKYKNGPEYFDLSFWKSRITRNHVSVLRRMGVIKEKRRKKR
jgi:hypothetical protein